MKLAEAIKVRLTEGQAARYAAEADSRGVAISTYIRERLEEADNRGEELAGIRAALIDLGDAVDDLRDDRAGRTDDKPAQVDAGSAATPAVQIEMLLLLRAIAGPQKMQMARGEVERQGYTPWAGTEDRNAPGR